MFVLLILNCRKYNWKRLEQRKFLQTLDLPEIQTYFHVQGDELLENEYDFNYEENLLTVRCKDDQMSLCHKTFLMIKAVHDSMPSITHVLKTDDDQLVKLNIFKNLLKVVPRQDYGGFITEVPHDTTSNYHFTKEGTVKQEKILRKGKYSNGRFYFLSRKCMSQIVKNQSIFFESTFEDNTVGHVLSPIFTDLKIYKIPDRQVFDDDPKLLT